jgi:hypothetical protein
VKFSVFGGICVFTLFCEENWFEEIRIWLVLGFLGGTPREDGRRGGTMCFRNLFALVLGVWVGRLCMCGWSMRCRSA